MASWSGIPELREYYRLLGPLRFWSIMAALLAWIGGGVWLQEAVGWPEAYGFTCHGRGCLFKDIWNSPELIRHGGLLEWLLFLHFMLVPATLLGSLFYALWRRFKPKPRGLVNDLLKSKRRDR